MRVRPSAEAALGLSSFVICDVRGYAHLALAGSCCNQPLVPTLVLLSGAYEP
jgi:hypothetical protein